MRQRWLANRLGREVPATEVRQCRRQEQSNGLQSGFRIVVRFHAACLNYGEGIPLDHGMGRKVAAWQGAIGDEESHSYLD